MSEKLTALVSSIILYVFDFFAGSEYNFKLVLGEDLGCEYRREYSLSVHTCSYFCVNIQHWSDKNNTLAPFSPITNFGDH